MRFICINCGAKEYIIGGTQPHCLTCWNPMVKATNSYAGIYMSPSLAMRRFESTAEKHGYQKALTGHCKQEREAWIASAWALCMQQETGREYWIEIETKDQTPDCKVHYIDQSKGYNHRFTHNLEIVEWDHHRPDFVDLVKQKCAKGGYPPYFSLVVLARNGKGVNFPDDLHGLLELKIPFSEMWMIGRASPDTTTYSVCMFHPYVKLMQFDLIAAQKKNRSQRDFLQPEGRGRGMDFKDRGVIYLPIRD